MCDNVIRVEGLTAKIKLNNGEILTTVNDANFCLRRGESYAVVGKSGSGKTSLGSILGLLNSSLHGEYFFDDIAVNKLSDRKLPKLRSEKFGFVFQNYSLIPHLRVWENIELPLIYARAKLKKKQRKKRISELLEMVGLKDRENEFPSSLSGGEQQRVAIARALVAFPEVLICDEPTGALDKKTGEHIMNILYDSVKKENTMLILVTHDPDLAISCDKVLTMDEGRIISVSHTN